MEELEYKHYVYSLLTISNRIKLILKDICLNLTEKHSFFDKEEVMKVLVRFHKSITFSDEKNYYNVLISDYKNYLADKSKYYKDLMDVLEETKRQRVTGEFFQHEYYLCCLKFVGYNNGYEYLNKEVKEEYKPFINAGNSGIYGRLPIRFDMEQQIVNEAFRILFHHFEEYCGGAHTDYMSPKDYPYEYVGKEGIVELYEKVMAKYEDVNQKNEWLETKYN